MSPESAGRNATCSTYTSIRGASWSRRLRAASMASALETSRVRWLRVVVRWVSIACHATGVSQLCGCCVPGCQYLLGLLGGGVCAGTRGNSGGDHGAAQLGEHVLEGGLGLGCVPGLVVAAGGEGVPGVAVPGVPGDDEGGHDQGERDGALDGAAGAVAGLAGAEDVAGVGEGLLDGPPGCIPGDEGGG